MQGQGSVALHTYYCRIMVKAQCYLGPSKATVKRCEQRLRAQQHHDAVVEAMQYLLSRNAATVDRRERRKRARERLRNASNPHVQKTSGVRSSSNDTERTPAYNGRIAAAETSGSSKAERKCGGSIRSASLSPLCMAVRERMKARAAAEKASRLQNAEGVKAALPIVAMQHEATATCSSRAQAATATALCASTNSASARPAFLANNSLQAPLALVATRACSAPASASSAAVLQSFAAANRQSIEQRRAVGVANASTSALAGSTTVLPPSFAATNSLRAELLLLPSHVAAASAAAAAPVAAAAATATAQAADRTQFEVLSLAYWVLGEVGRDRPVTAPQSIPNQFSCYQAYLQVKSSCLA
jgi:hypothetical protein